MRVLVTGANGFIGRWVVRECKGAGYEVSGVDILVDESRMPEVEWCDVCDLSQLRGIMKRRAPDAVIHLAARVDIDPGSEVSAYGTNTEGVRNIISAASDQPSVKRVIFTSTQLVCRLGQIPGNDTDFFPDSTYGESKVIGEKEVRATDGGQKEWCIVRPTTIWGPGMTPHYRRFVRLIERGRYVHVGREECLKSFGYVKNAAFQFRRLLDASAESVHGRVFYLADYEPIEIKEWADAFQRELGAPAIRVVPSGVAKTVARAGDLLNAIGWRSLPFNSFRLRNVTTPYVFDVRGTEAVCGRLPVEWRMGVRETVKWYREVSSGVSP